MAHVKLTVEYSPETGNASLYRGCKTVEECAFRDAVLLERVMASLGIEGRVFVSFNDPASEIAHAGPADDTGIYDMVTVSRCG